MSDEIVQEVIDRLDRIGELGGQGFEILIRQAHYTAFMYFLRAVFLIILTYVCYRLVKNFGYLGGEHIWAKGNYDSPSLGGGIFGSLIVVFAGFGVGMIVSGTLRLLNPEYYAIREILRSIGGE